MSVFHFSRETLFVIDKLYRNEKIIFPYPLLDIYPELKYFPKKLKELNEEEPFLKIPINLFDQYPYYPLTERCSQIVPHHLTIDQTRIILEKCKEKQVTVNSLLAAALIVSMKNHILETMQIEGDFTIKSSSGLNLRSYFESNIKPEQLGCWSGFGYVFLNSNDIKSIWDCAKIFQLKLHEFIEQNKPFAHLKNFIKIYSKDTVQEKKTETTHTIPYVILTNIGKLELEEWYGNQFQLEKVSLITPMHRHWANDLGFGIFANTFNNRLNLIFTYMKPARTFEQAEIFANKIVNMILEDSV